MPKGKLTRQELGWLLTHEAQGAAERLRTGVTALTQAPPPPGLDSSGVDATLSALDDAMKMLSNLHNRPVSVRGRRGHIDLASLVWEVAPEARVSIEPGSGTEVFGDEAELRRMLHVMLGHGSGSGSSVTIRRANDEVSVGVVLGPDSSATADTERAWLSRMAVRYGGRYELEGGCEVLALPAEGVEAREDLEKLRKELDEARKQGEAYARELAAVWAATDEPSVAQSSHPPAMAQRTQRHDALARFAGAIAAALRSSLSPVGRDLSEVRAVFVAQSRKSSHDLDSVSQASIGARFETIRRDLLAVHELVADLAAVGESSPNEPPGEMDLTDILQTEVRSLAARAAQGGVEVRLSVAPETRSIIRASPRAASVLVRELLTHAIAATPRGSAVFVRLAAPEVGTGLGARLTVDDGGTTLPAAARRALLGLEVEPGTFGRSSFVGVFVAAEIASGQGALLEIGDAPARDGGGGGVRVTVTFPR